MRGGKTLVNALSIGMLAIAENVKSAAPERVPFTLNRECAGTRSRFFVWSHFLRKTGSPLFRKML